MQEQCLGKYETMSGDGREVVHRELQRAFPSVYGQRTRTSTPVVVPGRSGRPQAPRATLATSKLTMMYTSSFESRRVGFEGSGVN